MSEIFLKHGGYPNLLTYQKAEIIYDATVHFANEFLKRGDRTIDQMVQAARSGKQNIAEASMAAVHSKESEIKLTGVARASLEELLIDYKDFIRTRGLLEWSKDHPCAARFRELNRIVPPTYDTFKRAIEHKDPEICANVMVSLIRVTTYLLKRQLDALERDFLKDGGLRERMTQARLAARKKGTGE